MKRLILLALITSSMWGCSKPHNERQARRFYRMDTVTDILFYDHLTEAQVDSLSVIIDSLFLDWENRFSAEKITSEIFAINSRDRDTIIVSPQCYAMVKKGIEFGDTLDGLFDISLLPLKKYWNISCADCTTPDPRDSSVSASLKSILAGTGYHSITLLDENQIAFPKGDSIKIDLGGIAKGFAIEAVRVLLVDAGLSNFLISAGGDILAQGKKFDGSEFRVGIQESRSNGIAKAFPISNRAVVTSGDYQRYRIAGSGTRVHHIFDPRTGYSSTANQSVTIVANSPIEADILSTGLFHLSADEILTFINDRKHLECFIIDSAGGYHQSTFFDSVE